MQLPDYHEIIEHPMDFGTVRRKLDQGLYSNLEDLEVGCVLWDMLKYDGWVLVHFNTVLVIFY